MPLDAFSDLGWRERLFCRIFLANARNEWLPHGEVQRARFGERAKFSTIISTNMTPSQSYQHTV